LDTYIACGYEKRRCNGIGGIPIAESWVEIEWILGIALWVAWGLMADWVPV
jgi:hypothetical protein